MTVTITHDMKTSLIPNSICGCVASPDLSCLYDKLQSKHSIICDRFSQETLQQLANPRAPMTIKISSPLAKAKGQASSTEEDPPTLVSFLLNFLAPELGPTFLPN